MEKFRQVDSCNGFSVGDTIHIQRWYYAEGSPDFNKMGNCLMVDVKLPIDRITIDEATGKDTIHCGKFSTSSTDIANKGIITIGDVLPQGWLDWNTLSLDDMVEHLRQKFRFSSDGDAKCIFHLIEFYDKQTKATPPQ